MLRIVVAALLAINLALFFWVRSDPQVAQSEREPARLKRQVKPEAVQVLPDLLTGASRPGSASSDVAAGPPPDTASGVSAAPR